MTENKEKKIIWESGLLQRAVYIMSIIILYMRMFYKRCTYIGTVVEFGVFNFDIIEK